MIKVKKCGVNGDLEGEQQEAGGVADQCVEPRKRVLWLMQVAPHYREDLLRELGQRFQVTVSCVPSNEYALFPPKERCDYKYLEAKRFRIGRFRFLDEFALIFTQGPWDAVICTEDMHFPPRYLWYLCWLIAGKHKIGRWVWWGHFMGRRNWWLLRWLRRVLVNSSCGALTYTEGLRMKLLRDGCRPNLVLSSNNTVVRARDFSITPVPELEGGLKLLYVGRNQDRKKILRLVELADMLPFVSVRLVGPLMEELRPDVMMRGVQSRVEIIGPKVGNELTEHFLWAHCVVAPGHLGLLVTDAARFGRPIIVDSSSDHAPEVYIAQDADQQFIDWSIPGEAASYFTSMCEGQVDLQVLADRLVSTVRANYTIETMADRFAQMIHPA